MMILIFSVEMGTVLTEYDTCTVVMVQAFDLTVLVFIKLTKNAVPLRFRCGSCKLKFCSYFNMFCDI